MRLVSIVPSISATLCAAGLQQYLVGCTQFCVEPANLHRSAKLVGGTKNPELDKIAELKPSLILVNSEENKPDHIELLKSIAPVHESFPKTPNDVVSHFTELAEVTGQAEPFTSWARDLSQLLASIEPPKRRQTALYFIWKQPYMVAARGTYIASLLEVFGFDVPLLASKKDYPEVDSQQIAELDPDVIFLSTEPYPFRKRDLAFFEGFQLPILKADGQLMSWHGYHTMSALTEYLKYRQGLQQKLFVKFS